MERRSLLKIFGAVAAGALIPTLRAAPVVVGEVHNAATLTAAMEQMFRCRTHEQRAFFELAKGSGVPYVELAAATGCYDDVLRVVYETFVVAVEDGDPKDAEAQLAQHFYTEFKQFAADKPLLYWRCQPEFQSEPVTYYGDTFMTREQFEDGVWKIEHYTRPDGRESRRYVADKPLVIPAGVEMDPDTGAYRWVTKKVQLHKMRMRLAIPQVSWKEDTALAVHAEGTATARI